MKRLIKNKISSLRGFTLLEVIVTITLVAILAAFFIAFMGTAVTQSADPVIQVQNLAQAEATLENISSKYIAYLTTGIPTWEDFKSVYCSPFADCTVQTSGCTVCGTGYETVEASIIVGSQRLIVYYMQ